MNAKALRASWIMLLVVFAIAMLSGVIMLFDPSFFLAGEFKSYTGMDWREFSIVNPRAISFFLLDGRQMGLFMVTLALLAVIVLLFGYRRGDRLSWYLCLLLVAFGIGGSLGFDIPTGDRFVIILISALLGVAAVALALGAGPILGRKDTAGRR
jgi:hypothetical protein